MGVEVGLNKRPDDLGLSEVGNGPKGVAVAIMANWTIISSVISCLRCWRFLRAANASKTLSGF
jgi:hypothetical protein